MARILDAADAVAQIGDGTVLTIACSSGVNLPEETLAALGARFQHHGHPRDLTVVLPINAGDMFGLAGIDHLAAPGLVRRLIGGSYTSGPSRLPVPAMRARIAAGEVEAYNLPTGWLYQLHREIAAKRPGVLTDVGVGTFVDPRQGDCGGGGGRMNAATREHLVHVVKLGGREWLYLPSFRIDWAIIRATTADERGNLTFEREASTTGAYVQALAAHNSGGRVIAQVERIAAATTLSPQAVRVPGVLVDYIVVDPEPQQATQTRFDPSLSGELRRPLSALSPVPFGPEKVIVRRAAQELRRGMTVSVGYGISALVPRILLEEGVLDQVTFVIEQGAVGGLPLADYQFGCSANAEAFVSAADQLDFLQGGGCDVALLSFLEVGPDGSVNASLLPGGNRPHATAGVGGFIDITAHTPRLVFSGYFTAGGLEVAVANGRLVIRQEGHIQKFVAQLAQVTLNGSVAQERGQSLTYVTERGVFRVLGGRLTLVEVAPGVDVRRDILEQCGAPLAVSPHLQQMDRRLFNLEPAGLRLACPQGA